MEPVLTLQHGDGDACGTCVPIRCDDDVISARQRARTYALALGFSSPEATLLATAISELARNIVQYAQQGEIALQSIERDGRSGLLVIASDRGPGIPEEQRLALDSPQSHRASGLGLRAIKRLMDDVQLLSMSGEGTTVRVTRWKPLA
jgi:serine/threonine-protein kinase RsbT